MPPFLFDWRIVFIVVPTEKEEFIMANYESKERKYGEMTLKEVVETVITDGRAAGTITFPLRTEGYHTCSNLLYTDRL